MNFLGLFDAATYYFVVWTLRRDHYVQSGQEVRVWFEAAIKARRRSKYK